MDMVLKILLNRNFLMLASLIAGLVYPKYSYPLKGSVIPLLAVVMAFSVSGIPFSVFGEKKALFKALAETLLLNYLLFGAITLGLAYAFIGDSRILLGFAVIAATPPGVAVIPFTFNYKGDLDYALKAVLSGFVASFVLTPTFLFLFAGGESVNVSGLFKLVFYTVIIPLFASRILRVKGFFRYVEALRGRVIDLGFAVIIYAAVGLNSKFLFGDLMLLLKCSVVLAVPVFLFPLAVKFFLKSRVFESRLIPLVLLSGTKSSGFAIAVSLAIAGEKAAIPSSVLSVLTLLFLIISNLFLTSRNQNLKETE